MTDDDIITFASAAGYEYVRGFGSELIAFARVIEQRVQQDTIEVCAQIVRTIGNDRWGENGTWEHCADECCDAIRTMSAKEIHDD